jgi:FtsZ-interacting cell division protein ZipA
MSLTLALLLIGAVIIISVTIGALDQARVSRRRRRKQLHREMPGDTAPAPLAVVEEERESAAATLEKRALTTEAQAASAPEPVRGAFFDELDRIERAINVRLDVDPDIDRRTAVSAAPTQAAAATGASHPGYADEKIDFIVTLPGRKTVSRHEALGLFRQHEYMLDKPRAIYGLRHVTGVWSNLDTDAQDLEYDDLRLAVQLADVDGPVSESELNTFSQMALQFADKLGRRTLFSMDFEDALALAQDLDRFCKEHDVIASFNVVATSPAGFPGRALDNVLSGLRVRYGEMRIYHRRDERGAKQFSIANLFKPGDFDHDNLDRFTTKGITLFMQVPCVADPLDVFDEMIEVGVTVAGKLGGRLVDQERKPLTEGGIEAIRSQIRAIAQTMRTRGVDAGSEAALRLFSL